MADLLSNVGGIWKRGLGLVSLSGAASAGSSLKGLVFYSPFERMFHSLKYLSIVIDKGAVTACVIKTSSSGFKIVHGNTFSGTFPGPDELVLNLTVEATAGLKTILSVPKEWCIVTTAEFPAIAVDNLSTAIAFQMPDLTPFSVSDVYYDYEIIKREDDKLTVAICAVKRQMVEPYLKALDRAGFKVSSLVLSAYSLVNLLAQVTALSDDIIVVNFKKTHVELVKASQGRVSAVYTVKGVDSVDPVIGAIEGLRAVETTVVVCGGDTAVERELKATLACQDVKDLLPALYDAAGYEYLTATAEALTDCKRKSKGINMLSMGEPQKKSLPIALTVVLSIIVVALFTFSLYIPVINGEKALEDLDRQIKALKPEYERLTAIHKDTRKVDGDLTVLNSMLSKRVLMMELLRELTVTLPDDTWLARIIATEKDINLEGYAVNASALIGMLENSKFFKDVGTASTTFKDARMGKERFQIKAALKQ